MTSILGISAFYHDSAASLVIDGEIVAAAQEERFTRVKHDRCFPVNAINYCLGEAGIALDQLNYVGFYEKPLRTFGRVISTYLDFTPSGLCSFLKGMHFWVTEKLWIPWLIKVELAKASQQPWNGIGNSTPAKPLRCKVLFGNHHESHAASAFYPSPFEDAAILTIDGVGEWATSTIGLGQGNTITILKELEFPNSLGLLYSVFTYYLGFQVNDGEYKVMGLAPYGRPKYAAIIRDKLVEICEDGSLRLNPDYFGCNIFGYSKGLQMTTAAFNDLLGGPPRVPETHITQREMDIARSIQDITEDIVLKMARYARRQTGMKKLCMAGGVALNCVANSKILRERVFDDVWIQPAAGDAGGSLGMAFAVWHRYLNKPRISPEKIGAWQSSQGVGGGKVFPYADGMKGAFLGPRYQEEEIEQFLKMTNSPYRKYSLYDLPGAIADLLVQGMVVGLHQGRMEFGPRALGCRSIIADPRLPTMQSIINLKIKFRESFRPVAPSVLREYAGEWFEPEIDSPYMLLIAGLLVTRRLKTDQAADNLWGIEKLRMPRSEVPAVTHVDYTARVHMVRRDTSSLYWKIIDAFRARTGCPMIVNTSLNVRGEPIACTPHDSYWCFMRTGIDALVLETCILKKEEQPGYLNNAPKTTVIAQSLNALASIPQSCGVVFGR